MANQDDSMRDDEYMPRDASDNLNEDIGDIDNDTTDQQRESDETLRY